MTESEGKRFREQVREGLQQTEKNLSPKVLQALQAARSRAVEAAAGKSSSRHYWVWAGGFASMLLAVLITLQMGPQGIQESMLEDLAMLSAAEELELYQDLEFYDWLIESEQHG